MAKISVIPLVIVIVVLATEHLVGFPDPNIADLSTTAGGPGLYW